MATSRPWPAWVASWIASRMSAIPPASPVSVARRTAPAERARGARQAELVCEGEGTFGSGDCRLVQALEGFPVATSPSASTMAGPGGSGSRRASASAGRSAQRGSARRVSTTPSRFMASAWAGRSPRWSQDADRLFQRVLGVVLAGGVEGCLGEADQDLGAVGVALGGERERALQVGQRCIGVEGEGAPSGEGEEAPGRIFERWLPGLPGRRRGRGRARSRSGRRARLRGLRPGLGAWDSIQAAAAMWRGARAGAGAGSTRRHG